MTPRSLLHGYDFDAIAVVWQGSAFNNSTYGLNMPWCPQRPRREASPFLSPCLSFAKTIYQALHATSKS
jgi:hypothetical protein